MNNAKMYCNGTSANRSRGSFTLTKDFDAGSKIVVYLSANNGSNASPAANVSKNYAVVSVADAGTVTFTLDDHVAVHVVRRWRPDRLRRQRATGRSSRRASPTRSTAPRRSRRRRRSRPRRRRRPRRPRRPTTAVTPTPTPRRRRRLRRRTPTPTPTPLRPRNRPGQHPDREVRQHGHRRPEDDDGCSTAPPSRSRPTTATSRSRPAGRAGLRAAAATGGMLDTDLLDEGMYWIVETIVPAGFIGSDPILVELNIDPSVTCVWDCGGLIECKQNDGRRHGAELDHRASSTTRPRARHPSRRPAAWAATGSPDAPRRDPAGDRHARRRWLGAPAGDGWRLVLLAMAGLPDRRARADPGSRRGPQGRSKSAKPAGAWGTRPEQRTTVARLGGGRSNSRDRRAVPNRTECREIDGPMSPKVLDGEPGPWDHPRARVCARGRCTETVIATRRMPHASWGPIE